MTIGGRALERAPVCAVTRDHSLVRSDSASRRS